MRCCSFDLPLRFRSRSGQERSTLLLTVYGLLVLVVVLIVFAATRIYLEHRRLFTPANGAALPGAESLALDAVAIDSGLLHGAPNTSEIHAADTNYLAAAPHLSLEAVALTRADTADGQSATVTLRACWRPPVLALFVPDGLPVQVTAVAGSVFG